MMEEVARGALTDALGPENVISDPVRPRSYKCDGLTRVHRGPALVALPPDTSRVPAAVRICHQHGVPFPARGAATGLSGGALPVADGVVISSTAPAPSPRPRPS